MVVILLIIIACCLLFGAKETKSGILSLLVTFILFAMLASCAASCGVI